MLSPADPVIYGRGSKWVPGFKRKVRKQHSGQQRMVGTLYCVSRPAFHRRHRMRLCLAVIVVGSIGLLAQTRPAAAQQQNPKVRAITAFVRLDRDQYRKQIDEALAVLVRAKAEFVSSGYQVESLRITTQPLAELVAGMSEDKALAFLSELDDLSVKENFLPDVGPAM